jgi:DNA repair protein RecO (recombination protein O)
MTLLDLVAYHREKKDLQHLREAEISQPFHSIATDLRKSTIALFLSEVLMKALHEGEANEELFSFIASSLQFLEMQEEGIEYFHLFFLSRLSLYLGFYPRGNPSGADEYFDLREGRFTSQAPSHSEHLSHDLGTKLYMLSTINVVDIPSLNIGKAIRAELLDAILVYYQIHLGGSLKIKSAEVLKEVFH